MTTNTTYTGTLLYPNGERVVVDDFIVRPHDIAFRFSSVTRRHGSWSTDGANAAVSVGSAVYEARHVTAEQHGVPLGTPWRVVFRLTGAIGAESLEVQGEIHENGNCYEFSGTLTLKLLDV